jgi:hypothetical protein
MDILEANESESLELIIKKQKIYYSVQYTVVLWSRVCGYHLGGGEGMYHLPVYSEAEACSFKMLVTTYKTTWHHKPEDHKQNLHHSETLKFFIQLNFNPHWILWIIANISIVFVDFFFTYILISLTVLVQG